MHGLKCSYGQAQVLHGIDIEVFAGEIVSIIGANGAGKSTTLMCVSRINRSSGSIEFNGASIASLPPEQVVRQGLVQVPEGRRIFPRLTVRENLEMGAFIRSDKDGIEADLQRIFEMFPILKDRALQQGGTLSGGEQQMLAIGRALMSRPKMLMMDEPSMGIAPILVAKIFDTVKNVLNAQGMTILLVEQNANAALRMSNRAYVLETGNVVLTGSGQDLLRDPRVREAYLG
ncbi:MAG: ABC transporter ATP-binding protein [Planctomycetota bacterium]|nr:MAG: ABC transporter ATP-binding protein [Planctomycetota bacterium]RLS51638.1 MAG: ABC transporter ATP-binding protein [Planctomycetota bacterium]